MTPDRRQDAHDWSVEEAAPCHFDHDEIDRQLVEAGDLEAESELWQVWEREAKCSAGGEILMRLIDLLLPSSINPGSPQKIGIKLIALAWMMQAQRGDLGSMPMARIARKLKVSRAILSHWVRHFEKALGFHARGQRRTSAIAIYQKAAARGWETRREPSGRLWNSRLPLTPFSVMKFSSGMSYPFRTE